MRIIGIDPGYERLGVAILEKERGGAGSILATACIRTEKGTPHPERLLSIGTALSALFDEWEPDAVATERLYFSTNVKTALLVAEARGVILCESARARLPIFEYNPADVKIAVTGHGGSDKRQVTDMVKRLITVPKEPSYDDEYDAIAIAMTCAAIDGRGISLARGDTHLRPSTVLVKRKATRDGGDKTH